MHCTVIFHGGSVRISVEMIQELIALGLVQPTSRLGEYKVKDNKQNAFWKTLKHA